jgi:hypothetical protein
MPVDPTAILKVIGAGLSLANTVAKKDKLKEMKAGAGAPGAPGMAVLAQGAMENSSELGALQDKLEMDAEEAKVKSLDVPEELV